MSEQSETQELLKHNEKITLEPKLLKHYESDTIIQGLGSYTLFLDDFKSIIAPAQKIFYESFYKDYVIYYCYLKYNRKAVFEYKLEYRDGISLQQSLDNIKYNQPDIKVYQLPEDYSKIKQANYLRELKQLKEKYNIKE